MDSVRRARAQHASRLGSSKAVPNAATPDLAIPGTWQPLGPAQVTTAAYGAVTGRVTSLAADPSDFTGNTLYLGATGGGIWKSTNAAALPNSVTFTPLTDTLPAFSNTLGSLSIGALSVQPTSSNVILAGTGDPNNALDSYYGVGILRSNDAGNTWTLIEGSKDVFQGGLQNYDFAGNGFAGFAWSSVTPTLVVAAVAQSLESVIVNAGSTQNMEAGLYYSSDAGQTWYLGIIEDDASHIVQSPNKQGAPPGNSVTSVLWNPVRKRFYAAVRFHGYYESTDGITWKRLANQPGTTLSSTACPTNPGGVGQTSCPIFRGALAVQPVTGDMFTLTTDLNDLDQGLFQDVCSTNGLAVTACASGTVAFGKQIGSGTLENGGGDPTIALADYDLTLSAVASQQDTILFAGTEDIYRCSLANSCAWRNTTNIQTCAAALVAPSQHATESTFGSNGLLYFANDGGLWRSTDAVAQSGAVCASSDASHYQNLNSGIGSLAEIEHFSVSPNSPNTLLAGMGGFGTVATTSGQGAWHQLLTGEGSYTAIDPSNLENWYTEAGSGVDILRCTAGANCNAAGFGSAPVIGSTQDDGDADYFVDAAPWILDPLNSANLLLGTCRVWRGPASGGSSWSASNLISPMLDGNQQPFCNGNAELRSIAAGLDAGAPAGSEQMYAGMAGPYDGGGTIPGHIFTSTVPASGGQTSWSDLYHSPVTNSSNNPRFNEGGFSISSIAVDPHDATGKTLYATTQGFSGNGISGGEVYGSTDGGAHWLNLTSSLPLAPANSVVVDPNVPSVLYVALDTGVYYTQNVATCSSLGGDCWAVYGSGLPNAPVTSLQIFSAGGSSILEASTYGRGIWALGLLTAPAQGTLTPSSYVFGSRQIATTSAAATFTLANTGSAPVAITSIESNGDYTQTNNCGASLASSASCTIQVTFTPTIAGDRPGTLTVYANVSGSKLVSTLDGTGLSPGMLTVTPSPVSFPPTVLSTPSAAQSVNVQNTGGIAVQLQAASVTTDYQISSNTCGSSLSPGASCSIGIVFTPSGVGDRPGHLTLPSSLPGTPTLTALDGTGVAPAALTLLPASLTFPSTADGTVSAAQSITVTSSGGAPVQLQTPTIQGDYQIKASNCPATLATGATCVIQIAFAPAATGSRAGLLTIPANVSSGQVTASLSGKGVNPAALTLFPTSLLFPPTTQGVTSAPESIQLISSGGVAAQLQAPSVSGNYAISASTCGSTLAPGANCTLQITFTPTATGDRAGLLTVPANVVNGHVTVPLDGTGLSVPMLTLSPASLSFGAVSLGSTSPAESISVTNFGGTIAQLLTPTTTGDFAIVGNTCSSTLAPGANCTLQITFSPAASGTRSGLLTLGGTNLSLFSQGIHADNRSRLAPDLSSGQVTAALSGTGVAPAIVTFSPNPANFGSVVQGAASTPPQIISVINTGSIAVQLQTPTITGNFFISATTCTSSLAANATCAIDVYFHPETTGALYGVLTLSGSMQGSPITDMLSGIGTPPGALSVAPTSLSYSDLLVGSSSPSKTVTITNTGGTTVTLPQAVIATGNASDFAIASDSCGTTLAPNMQCTIGVTFHPAVASARHSQLQQSDAAGDQLVVSLGGNGLSPLTISPAAQNFGAVVDGATSSPIAFTVANPGGTAVSLSPAAITGDTGGNYSISSNTCGASLGPNPATCTINLIFQPQSVGPLGGALAQPSEANTPTASLTGNGLAPGSISIAPLSYSYPATLVGSVSAMKAFTLTNGGAGPVSVSPVIPVGYQLEHSTCPGTLAASASCELDVAFAPTLVGDQPGTLTFSGSATAASLDGTGLAPAKLTFSPPAPTFGSVLTGASSSPQVITLTNTGGVPLQLGAPSVTSEYSLQGGTCQSTTSLSPAAANSCTLQIVFSPAAAGDQQGLLTVPGSMPGGSSTASLEGTGVLPGSLSLSPPLTSFGQIILGATSVPRTLTVSNSGGSVLAMVTAALPAEYQIAANGCTGPLAAGASCALSVAFTPAALGDQSGTIAVSANGGAIQAHATLDGLGVSAAKLVFAPVSLLFGSVQEGKSSPQQTVTLGNTGGSTAQLLPPLLVGDYAIGADSCGSSLAPSADCTLQITFSPAAMGSRAGSITVTTADRSSTATLALTGTGTVPPSIVLTPAALTFSATLVGATASAENVTVANVGASSLTLQPFTITGDFNLSADSCTGIPLNPTYSCTLSVTFAPTAGGQRTGLLTVSDTSETHTVILTGTGLNPATDTLSATSLSFAPQVFGTVSPSQTVYVTNSGGATLGSIVTTVAGPFTATQCGSGTILGGGLTCPIAVQYAPTAIGAQIGTLTISDALQGQTVSLNGQGLLPPQGIIKGIATPLSLDFGPFAINATSPIQPVTMTNDGVTPLEGITAAVGTGNFVIATNTCGTSLAAGASCTLGIAFNPQQVANAVDQLTLTSTTLHGPLSVSLSGSGEDFQLSVAGSSSVLITNGQTATYQVVATPVGGSAGVLSFTCSGAPANSSCLANPSSLVVSGGATGSITVTIATGLAATPAVRQRAQLPDGRLPWRLGYALALLAPWCLLQGRSRRIFLVVLFSVGLVLAPIACGVHASGGSSAISGGTTGSGSTPPGKYAITITGSFPGAQRTANLTLTVE